MFKVEFDTSNSAFDNLGYEVLQILDRLVFSLENYPFDRTRKSMGPVKDSNGNTVGEWEYVPG